MMKADWSRGIRDRENQTPEHLKACAKIALERASEWVETAEQLIAKANDLDATRTTQEGQ